MSTSDQQEQGPLTRKQLREIRLTGSTPVISADEAAAAAAAAPAAPAVPPVPPLPRPAEPVDIAPEPGEDVDSNGAPLTRRQIREQERIKTASVPIIGGGDAGAEGPGSQDDSPVDHAPEEEAPVEEAPVEEPEELVSEIPAFSRPSAEDDDDDIDEQVDIVPVSAAAAADTVGEVPLSDEVDPVEVDSVEVEVDLAHVDDDPVAAVAALGIEVQEPERVEDEHDPDDVLADVDAGAEHDLADGERPVVSEAFGHGLLADAAEPQQTFTPSFDELLSAESTSGSQHTAPNTLIFNPPAGEGSLDGPVASTGEILVTGSYELPQGIGSQGHAHGVADGKDVDAVLIDGELPPASSPTPIAASSAISTIKPAGEVIRPPAPEKGNKLMLTLAIVAGGLALALGVVLIIAFTTKLI